jgi:hypothetical protein
MRLSDLLFKAEGSGGRYVKEAELIRGDRPRGELVNTQAMSVAPSGRFPETRIPIYH